MPDDQTVTERDPLGDLRSWLTALVRSEIKAALAGNGEYLSTAEAASIARVAPGTLRRWVRQGRIVPLQAGRELRFKRDDLEALMAPRARARRVTRQETPEEIGARIWGASTRARSA